MKQFLPFLLLYSLLSCQGKRNTPTDKFQLLLPDTAKTHRPNKTFEYLRDLGKTMKLPGIDTGVNGITLRLWITSILTPKLLVTLTITDSSVTAQKFDYYTNQDGITFYKPSERGFGGDSLHLLTEKLKKIDFPGMISQSEIVNFYDNVSDGINYNLEIATSAYYKLLTYHCPERFARTEPNNKKFLEFLLLLDRHLHFYSPICAIM